MATTKTTSVVSVAAINTDPRKVKTSDLVTFLRFTEHTGVVCDLILDALAQRDIANAFIWTHSLLRSSEREKDTLRGMGIQ